MAFIRRYLSSKVGQLNAYFDPVGFLPPKEFAFYPGFFDLDEQKTLLSSSLKKLDAMGTRESRRRRKKAMSSMSSPSDQHHSTRTIDSLFLPDEFYDFEEGHYDGVIRNFREAHLTSWAPEDMPLLAPLLDRLQTLLPTTDCQTHLLHLGSEGEILPHIDNVHASGSWILGVSLGAERVMRMESTSDRRDKFDVLLPSGSVYLQRGSVRFGYNHSILTCPAFHGRPVNGGQRVSVMIRDRKPFSDQ